MIRKLRWTPETEDGPPEAWESTGSLQPSSAEVRRFAASEAHRLHLRLRGAAALTRRGCVRPLVDRGGTAESPRAGRVLGELPGVGVEENDLTWAPGVEIAWPGTSQSVSSVAQSCPSLCGPMDCSAPGLPVHHQLREFTQTHVH